MADPTREQIFHLAAQHCDQTVCNRERAVQGWNFSKDGLLTFVRSVRELEATSEEADRARWDAHIRMERQTHAMRGPNTEVWDAAAGLQSVGTKPGEPA